MTGINQLEMPGDCESGNIRISVTEDFNPRRGTVAITVDTWENPSATRSHFAPYANCFFSSTE